MTPSVFISYRREDTKAWAGRIYDRLVDSFGAQRVFLDVGTLRPGQPFQTVILETLSQCHACLVLIGPNWLNAKKEDGTRRLDDPEDLVRIEIETAFQTGVEIIPVLVDGAQLPTLPNLPPSIRNLNRLHVAWANHEQFDACINRLIYDLSPRDERGNPFMYLWLATGAFLNITGLAHIVGDAVKWIDFFNKIWVMYRLFVRDPILKLILLVWPTWWPPFPKLAIDWFVVWSGIWIAINIYHYQFSGRLKLLSIFTDRKNEVNENLFFATKVYWMFIEAYAVLCGLVELCYQYMALPIRYFYYATINKSPLKEPYRAALKRSEALEYDLWAINDFFRSRLGEIGGTDYLSLKDIPAFRTLVLDIDAYTKSPSPYLEELRHRILQAQRELATALDKHYLFMSARRVMVYYASIVGVFICVLFLNYTILTYRGH